MKFKLVSDPFQMERKKEMELLLHQTQISLDQRDQFIFSLRMTYKAKTRDLQSRFARWRESYIGSASAKNSTHGPPRTLNQLENMVDFTKLLEKKLEDMKQEVVELKDQKEQLQTELNVARVKAELFGEMRELLKNTTSRGISEKILQWQNSVFEMKVEKLRLESLVNSMSDELESKNRDYDSLEKKHSLLEEQSFKDQV